MNWTCFVQQGVYFWICQVCENLTKKDATLPKNSGVDSQVKMNIKKKNYKDGISSSGGGDGGDGGGTKHASVGSRVEGRC